MSRKYRTIAIVLLAVLFVNLLIGIVTAAKSNELTPEESIKSQQGLHKRMVEERLRADYKAKKITIDEYTLYLARATFKPEKLKNTAYELAPEEAKIRLKDATPVIQEITTNWKSLSNSTQEELKWVFFRPTDAVSGEQHILPQLFESTNFVIHWTNGSDGGLASDAPDLTDSDGDGTPDYIEDFSSYFETTRSFEVTTLGFNAPPSDASKPNDANNTNPNGKYDVFVYNLTVYGYLVPEQPTVTSYSYIAVNKDYNWAPHNDDPEGIFKGAMKVTTAHEYFHAVQAAYDRYERSWWAETTSTYMEDEVYPQVNDNYNYLPEWFENSDIKGLIDTSGNHQYGNFIWAKRLSEDFGDIIIREIWEEDIISNDLTAIDNVLKRKGSSLNKEFKNFTLANYFLEDGYVDGADYRSHIGAIKGVYLEYNYNEATNHLPFTIDSTNVNKNAWMDIWAADYVNITMSGAVSSYKITFKGLNTTTSYDLSLATKKGGVISTKDFVLDSNKNGTIDLQYDSGYSDVVLIIRNSGDSDTSNPSWSVSLTTLNGLHASYYNEPIYRNDINAIATPTVERIDPNINFDWHSFGRNDPLPGGINDDGWWSADWAGFIYIPSDGTYSFKLNSDDGSWLFIDGQLVVNNGGDHAPRDAYGSIALTKGYYSMMVKYFESYSGAANINLYWKPPNESDYRIVPQSALYISPPAASSSNMRISKNAPASMDHGNTMIYTLYFNNFGGMKASNVVLQDTLPSNVEFISASDGGTYNSATRNVTWSVGSVAAFPSGRGTRTVTVRIPSSVPIGTVIQNTASISTSTPETRYDDNSANASTIVTGSNLPPDVSIGPTNGNTGGTPSVYWGTPVTFTYYSSCATNVGINIHVNDGGSDITGSMQETSPDTWTYTIRFYPRHGAATVTYALSGCSTPSVAFNIYIDPAGYIYDANTGTRISGATVWLQRPDGFGGWENVPTGLTPPISQPDVNPLITGADGQYQWDVLEGSYRVHVEAPGYYPADSIVVSIPPPVTDLHVGLTHLPDAIPPVTTAILHGSPGNNGWYISDVQVDLTATDNEGGSGVNRIDFSFDGINWNTYSVPLTIANEGATTVYYRSVDTAGNVESTKTQRINIDKTLPIITGAPITSPNANGWYNNNIVINFTASDNISGVDTVTPDTTISTEGASQSIVGTATDRAGNSNSTTVSGINIDKTPPQIVIYTPTNESVYILNQTLTANWSAYDLLSGIASTTGAVPNGSTIDTGIVGAKTFNVVAADNASNTADQSAFYIIAYNYLGILPPIKVDNSSIFKSGSTVPVKFRIVDANGNNVSTAVANLTYQFVTNEILGTIEEPFSNSAANDGNTFRYDSTDNLYIFNLGTSGMATGTYQLNIYLDDGTVKIVHISIKK